jgi:hypothetical protein
LRVVLGGGPSIVAARVIARWVAALAFLVCLLAVRVGYAAIGVSITSPQPNEIDAALVSVAASVTSTYSLSSVQAQLGSQTIPLTASGTSLDGSFSLAGVPLGPKVITVTATDILGGTGSAQVTFYHDLPPVPVLTAPTPFTAIHGPVQVVASCTDDKDNPCASLQIIVTNEANPSSPAPVALNGTGSINQMVDLSAFDGMTLTIQLSGSDSISQIVTSKSVMFVDLSPNLVPVLTVNGLVLDFDATRVLALDTTTPGLFLIDRATNAATRLDDPPSSAALTPSGAIWLSTLGSVEELRASQVANLGPGSLRGADKQYRRRRGLRGWNSGVLGLPHDFDSHRALPDPPVQVGHHVDSLRRSRICRWGGHRRHQRGVRRLGGIHPRHGGDHARRRRRWPRRRQRRRVCPPCRAPSRSNARTWAAWSRSGCATPPASRLR